MALRVQTTKMLTDGHKYFIIANMDLVKKKTLWKVADQACVFTLEAYLFAPGVPSSVFIIAYSSRYILYLF